MLILTTGARLFFRGSSVRFCGDGRQVLGGGRGLVAGHERRGAAAPEVAWNQTTELKAENSEQLHHCKRKKVK
jgi:hypothetical protein